MLFNRGRRRSERFAELLEESDGRLRRHRRSDLDAELAPLVAIAHEVNASTLTPEPTDEFTSGLRGMLIAMAEREGIGVTADEKATQAANRAAMAAKTAVVQQVRPNRTGRARLVLIVGVMAGALAVSGVSAASNNALPGNPLYQVKRTNERAQLALAGSDLSRGRLYLEFAMGRLKEASLVDDDWIDRVLNDMDNETEAAVGLLVSAAVAGEPAALDDIRRFVGSQRTVLTRYAVQEPAAAVPIRESLGLLDEIAIRTEQVKVSLDKNCGFDGADHLGLIPRRC